jgi:predicted restriction endonuclease
LNPDTEELLSVADITQGLLASVNWNTPASGINIPDEAADDLEELWQEHLDQHSLNPTSSDEKGEDDLVADEDEAAQPAEKVWQAICQRRGQADFRQSLLKAYEGRCCITDCNAQPALEAAHIVGYAESGSQHVGNGLLLRADVHTLFDLGLVRIKPETMQVVLDESLRKTSYEELHGRQIRLPKSKQESPAKALLQRWQQGTPQSTDL